MTGIQIGVSKSPSLPPGFYVPPIPFAYLVANGWTPPPEASETQEPTGSFFMRQGDPVNSTDRLTRAQVDLAVRHLTGRFYDEHGHEDSEQFEDFARKLAWQISGDNTKFFRAHLLEMLQTFRGFDGIGMGDLPLSMLRDCESDLNVNVNGAIGSAHLGGDWINRHNERQPANYPAHEARFNAMARAGRVSR